MSALRAGEVTRISMQRLANGPLLTGWFLATETGRGVCVYAEPTGCWARVPTHVTPGNSQLWILSNGCTATPVEEWPDEVFVAVAAERLING